MVYCSCIFYDLLCLYITNVNTVRNFMFREFLYYIFIFWYFVFWCILLMASIQQVLCSLHQDDYSYLNPVYTSYILPESKEEIQRWQSVLDGLKQLDGKERFDSTFPKHNHLYTFFFYIRDMLLAWHGQQRLKLTWYETAMVKLIDTRQQGFKLTWYEAAGVEINLVRDSNC